MTREERSVNSIKALRDDITLLAAALFEGIQQFIVNKYMILIAVLKKNMDDDEKEITQIANKIIEIKACIRYHEEQAQTNINQMSLNKYTSLMNTLSITLLQHQNQLSTLKQRWIICRDLRNKVLLSLSALQQN